METSNGSLRHDELRAIEGVHSVQVEGTRLRFGVHDLSKSAPAILASLSENGYLYRHVSSERPDLETVFLSLTGRSLRD